MRMTCKMGYVVIVRFELDLALGCSVTRLARHDVREILLRSMC
jgi:hypothetical protein